MNIAEGIALDLSQLSARQKQALIKLMARISEASYRRGFQQGVTVALSGEADAESAARLRRWPSFDRSPRGEKPVRDIGHSARRRFAGEFGSLRNIGLDAFAVRRRPRAATTDTRTGGAPAAGGAR